MQTVCHRHCRRPACMSFPLRRPRDFIPLFTLKEEQNSPIDTPSEASTRILVSSPGFQTQSTAVLVSPRPSLASWPSYASTYTSASTVSSSISSVSDNSRRVYKSRLTPDDFLLHAFGPSRGKLREHQSTLPPSSSNNLNGQDVLKKSPLSSQLSSKNRKQHSFQDKRYSLPAPPPSGTFITTKHPKSKSSERHPVPPPLLSPALSVSEMDPFSGDLILPREERSWSDAGRKRREPLMSEEQWREKAKKRVEGRKQRRMAAQQGNREQKSPIPIDIDWRPMEGSMGLPDPTPPFASEAPLRAGRKRASSHKNIYTPRNVKHVNPEEPFHDADELHALKAGINASKSMDNLDHLVARCAAIDLSDPQEP